MNRFLLKYLPLRAPDDGGAAGAAAAAAAAATPWHTGVDADTLGHWQNKGWKVEDPKEVAVAATKQARELERHFGVPADQLLKMPKADASEADVKAFWGKLGVPADPKEYDFSAVKRNGQPLDDAFATTLRDTMAKAFVPKDKATTIAEAVVKHLDAADSAAATINQTKIDAEKAALKTSWGANYDFNHLKAMEGARKLGITPEAVKAMEGQIGFPAVMEAMRKIGANTSEDPFIEGGGGKGAVTTREGAQARLNELMADAAWGKRLTAGDATTANEWRALTMQIDGVAA